MNSNKKTGLLLLGGATALFVLPKLVSGSDDAKQIGGGSGGGLMFLPSGFGTGEVTNPNTSLPNIVINEAPLPDVGTGTTSTKKSTSSSSPSPQISEKELSKPTGTYRDAVTVDTKKGSVATSDPVRFPISTNPNTGMVTVPTYGIGYGGTDTTIGQVAPTKKESTEKSSGSWFSRFKFW